MKRCSLQVRDVPAEGGKPVLEASVALMPRSLLVFKDHAYTSCMHGIDAVGVLPTSSLPDQLQVT